MSVPHTGRLTALIGGQEYRFDGDVWTGPAGEMLTQLQWARDRTPVHHRDIREVALAVATTLAMGDRFRILHFRGDAYPDSLLPGAID